MSINQHFVVGTLLRVEFEDSKMVWHTVVVVPTAETLDKNNWFGREALSLTDREALDQEREYTGEWAVVHIQSKDLSQVDDDWAGSPEVNEIPVYSDHQALLMKTPDGWGVEFGEFVSLVTVKEQN
jgi:hypothetical protein